MSDRQAWLRQNLPTVDQFAAVFGRPNFSVSFASEGGHVLGKDTADAPGVTGQDQARGKPCDGCRHSAIRLASTDGKRWMSWCKRYTQTVAKKCADYPLYAVKLKDN